MIRSVKAWTGLARVYGLSGWPPVTSAFSKQPSTGPPEVISDGTDGRERIRRVGITGALKIEENRFHDIPSARTPRFRQGKSLLKHWVTPKKAGQQQHGPGLDQVRRHIAIRRQCTGSAVIAGLSFFLKRNHHEKGFDHRINRVLMIRDQLVGQQGNSGVRFTTLKPGHHDLCLFEREKLNGVALVLADGPAAVVTAADKAPGADIVLKTDVEKICLVFPDI